MLIHIPASQTRASVDDAAWSVHHWPECENDLTQNSCCPRVSGCTRSKQGTPL